MASPFGDALRTWRKRRRLSQLALGLAADVSARRICFLETGRAYPSRSMVLRLCRELDVPLAERNHLLTAAGFAPAYATRALGDDAMRPIRRAVALTLDRHAPYPALAIDRSWRLLMWNRPAERLFGAVGLIVGDSMAEALARNAALRDAIENLDEVLAHAVMRLRTESAHLGRDHRLEALADELAGAGSGTLAAGGVLPPVVPARFRAGDARLALISTIAQFGSAEDILLSDLRIELMFPADAATEALFVAAERG